MTQAFVGPKNAQTEMLFDRPFEDRKIVRVSGPFTVESLSPHRVLVDGPEDEPAAKTALAEDAGRFVTVILDNLRRAGVHSPRPLPGRVGPGARRVRGAGAGKDGGHRHRP